MALSDFFRAVLASPVSTSSRPQAAISREDFFFGDGVTSTWAGANVTTTSALQLFLKEPT